MGCILGFKPSIKTPSADWEIIDPSSPSQDGFFSVPFDGTISSDVSASIFAKHGASERIAINGTNVFLSSMTLRGAPQLLNSAKDISTDTWKHIVVTVDNQVGAIKIFEDGNQTATKAFPSGSFS